MIPHKVNKSVPNSEDLDQVNKSSSLLFSISLKLVRDEVTTQSSSNSKTIMIAFNPQTLSSFPLLLLLTILILQLCATAAATTINGGRKSNETDHQALLHFKSKITADPFAVFASWNSSIHFCQWYGVGCGHRHQRVTTLDLSSSRLAGTISPHVGNLSFLWGLDLRNNSFSKEIPQEIGHLRRLKYLSLSNNTLSGIIPSKTFNLSNLLELDLSWNQLVGNIPPLIGSWSKLQFLKLRWNYLTDTIPGSFGNLSQLVIMDLGYNNLVGSIPDSFSKLRNLQEFSLLTNKVSGVVPPSLFNSSSIIALDLAINDLSGNLSPDLFISLPNITFFSIASNRISGSIPTSLSNSSNLGALQLQENQLTGRVPFLHNLQKLRVFVINSNKLGSGEANELSFLTSLLNATMLEFLSVANNSFRGVLPQKIGNFSKRLRMFDLWDNQIQGSIPIEISNLINLEKFDVRNNQLSGIIPSIIGKLTKLKKLYLNDNMFSGSIPPSLGNITGLLSLGMSRNYLGGSIPSSLRKCQNLLYLDLSQNNLTGTIPSQVIGLPSLSQALDLSDNNLNGSIPLEIGNLKNLGFLNLSSNMLSGVVPSTLSSCISLEELYLHKNLFEGSIPPSLSSLRALQILDLSGNRFSGEISNFVAQLNALQYLNMSFNNLEGSLPTDGIFRNAAGNSKLCGGMPEFQLLKCSSNLPNKKRLGTKISLVIGIVAAIFLGLIFVMLSLWLLKRKKSSVLNDEANTIMQLSYHDLYQATEGFSSANLIGEGSFGSVYKGTLALLERGRTSVAVKVLKLARFGAFKSFKAECEALKNIRHRNLVRVLTVCSSIDSQGNDFKALVYEFMVNGSLDEWLHHSILRANLLQRLHIAIDVACALDYLHHQNETPVVHCDIKPSNILLDEEMTAHIGDFGLARFLLEAPTELNGYQSSSVGVRGTIGYAPPEYGMGNKVAISGDVYSYGILLLEMFTGKRPVDEMFIEGLNLHNFVESSLPEQVAEILDPVLHQEIEVQNRRILTSSSSNGRIEELLVAIFKIGVACSIETPEERMRMDEVAAQLISIRVKFLATGRRRS